MPGKERLAVIKFGGHAMDIPELASAFMEDLAQMGESGYKFIIVHGGAPQIGSLLKRLDIKSEFVNGLRVTDAATLEVVEMILCGQVNKALVRQLESRSINAVGISGEDAKTLVATPAGAEYGMVGNVSIVNTGLLSTLLDGGYLPVIAPLALDAQGSLLNVNGDSAAGAIAGAMKADFFILVSNVPGILDEKGQVYPSLKQDQIRGLIEKGIISGGMIPKVNSCLAALAAGCAASIILDGEKKGSLKKFMLEREPYGTLIELD